MALVHMHEHCVCIPYSSCVYIVYILYKVSSTRTSNSQTLEHAFFFFFFFIFYFVIFNFYYDIMILHITHSIQPARFKNWNETKQESVENVNQHRYENIPYSVCLCTFWSCYVLILRCLLLNILYFLLFDIGKYCKIHGACCCWMAECLTSSISWLSEHSEQQKCKKGRKKTKYGNKAKKNFRAHI